MDSIATIVIIAAGLLTIVGYATGFFRWAWSDVVARLRAESPYLPLPKKSVTIVAEAGAGEAWWHMGKSRDGPTMQIVARCKATNITRYQILLVAAKLRKPKRLGMVMTKDAGLQYHGEYHILPGHTTDISLDFSVVPPVRNEGEEFVSDVAVVDQFGNEHWIRRIRFKYR